MSLATERELKVNIFREHNLKKLAKELKSLFDNSEIADPILIKQINGYLIIVESLTDFITDLDKNGTSFTYDVHSNILKQEKMIRVDLLKLNELFQQSFDFLVNTSDVLDDYYKLGRPFVDEQLKIDFRKRTAWKLNN